MNRNGRFSLLVVDDEPRILSALQRSLRREGYELLTSETVEEALRVLDSRPIDAILSDQRMPGTSGLTLLDQLLAQGVDQPVIMLTGHGTVEMCRRAFKAGAAEFLEKPVDDDRLLEALHECVRRHVRTRERLAADREARERYSRLSEREREVLSLVIEGLTAKQIARALGVSPRTVETHRANLGAKLETDSLAQLIRRFALLVEEAGTA